MRRVVPAIFLVFLFQLSLLGPAFGLTLPESFFPINKKKSTNSELLSVKEDVSKRSEFSTVWLTKVRENGKVRQGRYTQLTPGLYYNAGTVEHPEYKVPDTTIQMEEEGGVVENIGNPIYFTKSLNSNKATIEQISDGAPILSATPSLILYRDTVTDRTVVLAGPRPGGTLSVDKNIATYTDAFSGLRADLRYTVDPARVEQDVLLFEKPEAPSAYGLNDATTRFVVLTRLFHLEGDNAPTLYSPHLKKQASATGAVQGWAKVSTAESLSEEPTQPTKEALSFLRDGKMVQRFVRSYALDGKAKHPVEKRIVTLQGMKFLAEEIPAKLILEQDLPVAALQVANCASTNGTGKAGNDDDSSCSPSAKDPTPFKSLDITALLKNPPEEKGKLAQLTQSKTAHSSAAKPFVLDYISVTGNINDDYVFETYQTYLIDGTVTIYGNVTFEGGAVIKYEDDGELSLLGVDAGLTVISTEADSSRWTYFTSKNDDSLGETISGSTGTPTNYTTAMEVSNGAVKNAMILYAQDAIKILGSGNTVDIQDVALIGNYRAINAATVSGGDLTLNLKNLFIGAGIDGVVSDDSAGNTLAVTASNLTLTDLTGSAFDTTLSGSSTLTVNDSLFVNITNDNYFTGTSPTQQNFNAACCSTALPAGSGPSGQTNQNQLTTTNPIVTGTTFLDQASTAVIDKGSETATAAGLFYYRTAQNGTLEAATTVDIGFHQPPLITDYAVFATNSAWIKNNASFDGHVGVNRSSADPSDATLYDQDSDDIELVISNGVTVDSAHLIAAGKILIESGATVDGDVYYDDGFTNNGTLNGTPTGSSPFPIILPLPQFREATFETTPSNFTAPDNGSTLSPPQGSAIAEFQDVLVRTGETLTISGGFFNLNSLELEDGAKLEFAGAAEIRVATTIKTGVGAKIEPASGVSLVAHAMVFFAGYSDDGTTSTRAMDFGSQTLAQGIFYAQNGTIWLGQNAVGQGIFIARNVLMEEQSTAISNVNDPYRVTQVKFEPNGGNILDTDIIELTTLTSNATIYYTTDGTDPVPATPPVAPTQEYTGTFTLSSSPSTQTVKAIATRSGYTDSIITSADFDVTPDTEQVEPVVATPDPATGPFYDFVDVALTTATAGATIWYTTDGTDPTNPASERATYSGPINLTETTTIMAFAEKAGAVNSAVTTFAYNVIENTVAPVTATPDASTGPFFDFADVTLSTPTVGATIYYTLDGSDPSDPASQRFEFLGPISLEETTTMRAYAVKAGKFDSPQITADYNFQTVKFYSFEFVEENGRSGHEALFPILGQPLTGTTQQEVLATLLGPEDTANFRLVDLSGATIQSMNLTLSYGSKYYGLVSIPNVPFQVAVEGDDEDGVHYDITFPEVFESQTVEVNVVPPFPFLVPGVNTLTASVTNHGTSSIPFTFAATNSQGFISRIDPVSLTLGSGETGEFEFDVTVPSVFEEFTSTDFTLTATSNTNPTVFNTAFKNMVVFIPPEITPPDDITAPSTGTLTQVNIGQATATDNEGIHSITNDAPEEGFPEGVTLVKWTAMDTSGIESSAIQTITITP